MRTILTAQQKMERLIELVKHGYPSREEIQLKLGCKRANFFKIKDKIAAQYGYQIDYCSVNQGYHTTHQPIDPINLSHSATEKLVSLNIFVESIRDSDLHPILSHLNLDEILQKHLKLKPNQGERNKICYIKEFSKPVNGAFFTTVYEALLKDKQLLLSYKTLNESAGQTRTISPYQLLKYRGNWYLDAYCHLRNDWRTFILHRMESVEALNQSAQYPPVNEQQRAMWGSAFGLFSGIADKTAMLKFRSDAAYLVQEEQWHKDQRGVIEKNGDYTLHVPYADPTELESEILRYGEQVTVIEPGDLKRRIRSRLKEALKKY